MVMLEALPTSMIRSEILSDAAHPNGLAQTYAYDSLNRLIDLQALNPQAAPVSRYQ